MAGSEESVCQPPPRHVLLLTSRTSLSTNNINIISDLVVTVSGIATVGGAAVIGGLVLAGIMAGPAGWAALGTVATIAAIVGGIVLVWGIIEGGIERSVSRIPSSVLETCQHFPETARRHK